MEWKYVIALSSIILILLLVLKEARRKNRKNIAWRLIASVSAVVALACIALPPSYQTEKKEAWERGLVLLTEGFNKDSLSKFTDPVTLTTDEKLLNKTPGTLFVPSLDYYLASHPSIKTLHILGFGLPEDELNMLKNMRVVVHGAEKPFGFQNVNWPQKIKSGESLWVTGTFNNTSGKTIKLILKGLSTNLDSATIGPDTLTDFTLSSVPRELGLAMHSLIVISGKDTLSMEKVPFIIEKPTPLKILMLSSSPDFESNFLKNWLAKNNFSVAIRSSISKGKFSTEFINMAVAPFTLQSESLKKFDLLITDETALAQLNNSERLAVKNQLNNGMGLLVRDDDDRSLPEMFGRLFTVIPQNLEKAHSLSFSDNLKIKIPGSAVRQIRPQVGDQPLVNDEKGRIVVNSNISGLGRIVFSTVNDTYSWKLAGQDTEYSSFWSYVIKQASRKIPEDNRISVAEQFPVINNKNTLLLQTQYPEVPVLLSGEDRINLEQDAKISHRWQGFIWPVSGGWNFVNTLNGEKFPWYVYSKSDWESVRNQENLQATVRFGRLTATQFSDSTLNRFVVKEKIPVLLFYFLFLISCIYLWIETKLL